MLIYGKEYGFALTIGASAEIAAFCPGGELSEIDKALSGSYVDDVQNMTKMIVAMAKGYDALKRFEGEAVDHPPLTEEMIMSLPPSVFRAVKNEAMTAFIADMAPSVEVEPGKKKRGEDPESN